MFQKYLYLVVVILSFAQAKAQDSTVSASQTSKASVEEVKEQEARPLLTTSVTFEYSTNTQRTATRGKTEDGAIYLQPILNLGADYKLSVVGAITENFKSGDQPKFANTKIYFISPKWKIIEGLSFNPRVGGWAPTDQDAYDDKSYRGALELEPQVGFDISHLGVPVSGFYRLSLRQNFYQYDRSNTGKSNEEIRITNRVSTSVSILNWLGVSLDARFVQGQTYSKVWKERFSLGESVDVSLSDSLQVSVGHDNSGSAFKPDGRTSNIEVYDESQSIYSGAVTYQF